jgi:1-acyl-sn-glycerol-3-phosphate acyltransferase
MIIRSYIFDIILILFTICHNFIYFTLLPILLLLELILKLFSKKLNITRYVADKFAKIWSVFLMFLLRITCSIDYEIRGKEHIPNDQSVIIASKHQSMWETVIMHLIVNRPAYIFKKELLIIPFYGWYLRFMSGIIADREGGSKSLKSIVKSAKEYIKNKQSIIIFPQGTRTKIDANIKDYPYQSGLLGLYNFLKIPVIPAALNSGIYWNKKSKKPGKIIIEFLPMIKPGLKKKEFINLLQGAIEVKTKELSKYD